MDQINDVVNILARIYWEQDEERKKKMTGDFLNGSYPVFFKGIAARIEKNASERNGQFKYLVGDKLTCADIFFTSFITSIIFNELNPESGALLRPSFE